MRIKNILNRSRRDFTAVYKCEFCNEEVQGYGYDDANFHDHVVPNLSCRFCKKSSEGQVSSSAVIPPGVVM